MPLIIIGYENINHLILLFFLWKTTGQVKGIVDLGVIFGGFRHIWRKFNGGFQRTGVMDLVFLYTNRSSGTPRGSVFSLGDLFGKQFFFKIVFLTALKSELYYSRSLL